MISRRSGWWLGLVGLVLLAATSVCLLVWWSPELLGMRLGRDEQTTWWLVTVGVTLVVLAMLGGFQLVVRRVVGSSYQQASGDDLNTPALTPSKGSILPWEKLLTDLRERHGFFWRRKVRLFLVVGEPAQVAAIAPGLTRENWLEGQNTMLLWAGSVQVSRKTLCLSNGAAYAAGVRLMVSSGH